VKLDALQGLFTAVVTGKVPLDDPRIPMTFISDARLTAQARMHVYADMVLGRQVEALAAEFPMVKRLLGDDAFSGLAREYVTAHPSDQPDIGQLGRLLSPFIGAHPVRKDLAELAALERARSVAFLARDAETRTWEELAAGGPEAFATTALQFVPAFSLLQATQDLPALWSSLEQDQKGDPIPLEVPQTLAIWRHGFEVFHVGLSIAEADAVQRAVRGERLGEVCEPFAAEADPANTAFAAIASWFNEGWISAIVRATD
jgi:hypothetical protein